MRPFAKWIFYMWHRVEIQGIENLEDLTKPQARLLFSGHQNALADPIFGCVALPMQMHYFTRADVFANPLARALLLRLNMMPIFRPIDRATEMVERNQDTFNSAHARLESGACLGIFPEAGHLDERRIRQFKHGSARFILSALGRKGIQDQCLHVQPMALDFERYEGYRSLARIRVGTALDLSSFGSNPEDNGPNRIALSHQMREGLLTISVNLMEGPLYDPHLAICRFLEGHQGKAPSQETLDRISQELISESDHALSGFQTLIEAGMPHPRRAEAFAALGRMHHQDPSARQPSVLWRWPAWVVFMLTTGWWPRCVEPWMTALIRDPAYRTTFGIPLALIGICTTWLILAATAAYALGNVLWVPVICLAFRVAQQLAMPYEDRRMDRIQERQAQRFFAHPWIEKWCAQNVDNPKSSSKT
ncbi:1-acyl-sn-glycerol-3-phosphate acyltransferase [Flavobacteriales bacterium]|nr:1-acyl-sn-glycerol-3-phosphate acyltransferase [Flavobacteriales bacterium]